MKTLGIRNITTVLIPALGLSIGASLGASAATAPPQDVAPKSPTWIGQSLAHATDADERGGQPSPSQVEHVKGRHVANLGDGNWNFAYYEKATSELEDRGQLQLRDVTATTR